MWIHYLLSALLCIVPNIGQTRMGNKNKRYLIIVFFLFFTFAAFRAFNVGNDTHEYFRMFNIIRQQENIKTAISLVRYEPGFLLLYYVIGKITSNYTVILVLVTGIYIYSSLRFINKYSNDISVSVILFFSFSLYYDVFNIQRQCLVIAIFLYALDYLIDRKSIQYFILIAICTTFHISSIVLVALYFLPRADFKRATDLLKWLIIIVGALLLYNFSIRILSSFFPYYASYFNSMYSQGGVRAASIGFLLIRVIILGLLVLSRGTRIYLNEFNNTRNVIIQLSLIDVVVAAMSIGFNLIDRMEVFFAFPYIIYITNVTNKLELRNQRVIKVIAIISSYAYLTATLLLRSNWYGIFPYRFFWMQN